MYQSQRKSLQKGGWGKATGMNRAMPRDRPRLRDPWETEMITDKLGKERGREIPHWGNPRLKGKGNEQMQRNEQFLSLSLSAQPKPSPAWAGGQGSTHLQ